MKEPVDLVVELYLTGGEHAQKLMRRLGISYHTAVPQSLLDCWWFFNCRNVPNELPDAVSVRDFGDLNRLISLDKETVAAIYADRARAKGFFNWLLFGPYKRLTRLIVIGWLVCIGMLIGLVKYVQW